MRRWTALVARRRGFLLGARTALRLGPWRFQRCPVGPHRTLVTPVRDSRSP